jgi:hypothetical protein
VNAFDLNIADFNTVHAQLLDRVGFDKKEIDKKENNTQSNTQSTGFEHESSTLFSLM